MTAPTAIEPPSQFTTHERLSVLIHAGAKLGKSTLASTAPKPALVLDAEGSWRFIPVRKVYWDPNYAPPTYDGTWDVCIVTVSTWETVDQVYRWLARYRLPFVSVVLDSITEVQRRCKANLKGTDVMKIADWGVLLSVMDATIRGYRDMALLEWSNVRCVVFVSETRFVNNKWVPYMQGQIAVALPYWVDVCGYLYPDWERDENAQPTHEVRRLWIAPHPSFEAGERVQGRLGQCVTVARPNDGEVGTDIENWMRVIFSKPLERPPLGSAPPIATAPPPSLNTEGVLPT